MSGSRLFSFLSVCVVATATVAAAAPTATTKAKPGQGSGSGSGSGSAAGSAAGSGSGSATPAAGSAAPTGPTEDETPPKDSIGTDENPGQPDAVGVEQENLIAPPPRARVTGYPIELALRPITLPQNMSEVSLDVHAQISPYEGTGSLYARYGITRQVQLGLTYVIAGIYHDPLADDALKLRAGKAVGLDVTVLLTNFLGIKVGVPLYIDPLAVSLAIGAPLKFVFGDKFAIGGLDDLLNIRLDRFPPSFYQEVFNAQGAANDANHTTQSRGDLRFSFYAIYQQQSNLAFVGRIGVDEGDFSANNNDNGYGGTTTFLRGGVYYSPKPWADLAFTLGFDDLAHGGTFGPEVFAAVRI